MDAVNILFLEVEMLDALERYESLLKHDSLNDLLHLNRPAAVTVCLLTALYRTHLFPFEERADAAGALGRMTSALLPVYGTLFEANAATARPDARLSQALAAAARGASLDEFDKLAPLDDFPDPRRPYLGKVRALLAPPPPCEAASGTYFRAAPPGAPALLAHGDYAGAFLLAADLPPSPVRTWILCQCAEALGDLSVDKLAWEAIRDLPADARLALSKRPVVEHLAQRLGTSLVPPENWIQWFSSCTAAADPGQYLALARRGQDEWPTGAVLGIPERTRELQSLIACGPQANCEAIHYAAIPMVVGWMRRHPDYPRSVSAGIQLSLAKAIIASTQGRPADLEVIHDLIDAALEVLSDEQDYPVAVDLAVSATTSFGAPERFDWVIDLADTFVRKTPPRLGLTGLHRVIDEASTRVVAGARHATRTHWQLLETLHTDASHMEAFNRIRPTQTDPGSRPADPLAPLSHTSLAIYTLDQPQAARAKQLLETRVPSIRVTLLHDHANSVRLSQHARTSDLFVMVTRCATHAATGAIQSARRDKPILLPKGRGAASILREIEFHLAAG